MKGPLDPSDGGGTRHNTCDLIRPDFKDPQGVALFELSLKSRKLGASPRDSKTQEGGRHRLPSL